MIKYIIDLKEKENLRKYYALKDRFEEKIDNREDFIKSISKQIEILTMGYDYIIIPESSSSFVEDVVKLTNKKYTILKKNSKDYLFEIMVNMNLQRKERESHIERFKDMGDLFKINKLKANQRKRYINYLFENLHLDNKKLIFIDDSCFTGTTFEAVKKSTNIEDAIFIFSK